MLIAGTIICGGGPVVIPLLRGYTVDPGWVSASSPDVRLNASGLTLCSVESGQLARFLVRSDVNHVELTIN